MGKAAAPAAVIIAAGFVAEILFAGAAFAAIGVVIVVILAAITFAIYAKGIAEAAADNEWVWIVVMAVAPVAGYLIGHPIGVAFEPMMTNPHYHMNLADVLLILVGLYGIFGGWWIGPAVLRERRGGPLAAVAGLVSFASTAYVWTMIVIAVNHGSTTGYHWT